MSQNSTKDNPLLFSANIASPFDDIVSSTVILPPQKLELTKSEKKEDRVLTNETCLAEHSDNNVLGAASNVLPTKPITDLTSGPPSSKIEGGSSLRRPVGKYVLPPDMASRPYLPPPSNLPPSFNPRPLTDPTSFPAPNIPAFIPVGAPNPSMVPSATTFHPLPSFASVSLPSSTTSLFNPGPLGGSASPSIPPLATPPSVAPTATTRAQTLPSFAPVSLSVGGATSLSHSSSALNSSFVNHSLHFPTVPTSSSYSPPKISPSMSSEFTPGATNANVTPAFNLESHSTVIPYSFDKMASSPPLNLEVYHPVIHHWFYSEGDKPAIWKPFSFTDSINLEAAFKQGSTEKIACDEGRYDAVVPDRLRTPVYWDGAPGAIRRCSWFRKGYADPLPVPYSEVVADQLEREYREAITTGRWHRQIELPDCGERIMMNSPHSIHHYQLQSAETASVAECPTPQTVKRGTDEFTIPDGGSQVADHLLFLIHGIGSVCDLRFRTVEECVSEFRCMGDELVGTHFRSSVERGCVSRVEVLPISWHKELHGDSTGLDARVKQITLRSIPKFRDFTNDTLLDVLYYTSPVYCQHIMDTVASEMERLLTLFRARNPSFSGSVSVGGHSLGSVILFDLLANQKLSSLSPETLPPTEEANSADTALLAPPDAKQILESGIVGLGQPAIIYPQLSFKPRILFLLGSPVAMFITVRGIDNLGPKFRLPTCERVFNLFHPFDPVAYRLETLIDPSFNELRPVLIPHHKGRKRMHLELKDTIERVGSDLKNKIVDSIHSTWNKFWQIYAGNQSESAFGDRLDGTTESSTSENTVPSPVDNCRHAPIGCLNEGKRIDYVLQEKPYESFTEYIFALQAHVSYWNSEDTMLMILKEIYDLDGIASDTELPLQSQSNQISADDAIKRVQSSNFNIDSNLDSFESSNFAFEAKQSLPEPAPAPVPLFSPPTAGNLPGANVPMMLPPPSQPPPVGLTTGGGGGGGPTGRALRGRPVFDPLAAPISAPGMDPTATPTSDKPLPPPPTSSNVHFSQRGNP